MRERERETGKGGGEVEGRAEERSGGRGVGSGGVGGGEAVGGGGAAEWTATLRRRPCGARTRTFACFSLLHLSLSLRLLSKGKGLWGRAP